jgi:unsaturated pyranuronate lyase
VTNQTPDLATLYRWTDLPLDSLRGSITRRMVSTQRMTIAHVYLKKGDEVPRHSHENEQITYILSGALEFWLGPDDQQHVIVRAGEVLVIPPDLPHRALALEDTLDVDVFNPPREDWINKTDDYLRR